MSIEDPRRNPDDERPVDEDRSQPAPERLEVPLEAPEADVLEQALEVPESSEDQ